LAKIEAGQPSKFFKSIRHGDQFQLESSWLYPQLRPNTYFHFWLCGTFCGTFTTSHFLMFSVLSILISAMFLK